jgi:hypothetical protein
LVTNVVFLKGEQMESGSKERLRVSGVVKDDMLKVERW